MSTNKMASLEAAFLALESRDVPFVFACTLELERPVGVDALREHVGKALQQLPRYRQRVVRGRLSAQWIPDDAFQIDRQVHAARLPAPGGAGELDALVAQLLQCELPPEHPPWRMWAVNGLAGGRGAIIAVVHHSLVDGVAGLRLLEHILDGATVTPLRAAEPPPPVRRTVVQTIRKLARWHNATALAKLLRDGVRPASRIGLNPRHTGRVRAVAEHTIDMAEVDAIRRAYSVTTNDVVLATVSGALRRFLGRKGFELATLDDVRAMIPVNRHVKGEQEMAGNRVALLLAKLPVDDPDPLDRLRKVSATAHALKTGHSAAGGDLLVALSDLTTPALLAGTLRLALRMRAFNLIVTNVPGPRERHSLLGVPVTRLTPIVNLWPHQSVGIAVASYAGQLTFGIQTDRAVVPEVNQLRDDLAAAFEELMAPLRESLAS